jgi:hypothetical protein
MSDLFIDGNGQRPLQRPEHRRKNTGNINKDF